MALSRAELEILVEYHEGMAEALSRATGKQNQQMHRAHLKAAESYRRLLAQLPPEPEPEPEPEPTPPEPEPTPIPELVSPPSVSGPAVVGNTLSVSPGEWLYADSYAYEWEISQ